MRGRGGAAGADVVIENALVLDFFAVEDGGAQHHLAALFRHRTAVQPEGAHPFAFMNEGNKTVLRRAGIVVQPAHRVPAFPAVSRAHDADAVGVGFAADAIEPVCIESARRCLDD